MTQEEAIRLVQEKLARHPHPNFKLEVVPSSIRHDSDDWWFIGVKPVGEVKRRFEYYDIMAQVSREIEDENGEGVTLVPPPSGTK
jgi:hypothetical protein